MSRRRGPTPKKGTRRARPDSYWRGQEIDRVLEDIYVNTLTCRFGSCGAPAVRWYLRTDLDAERLVIYPTCFAHAERAEAETCGDGCLAPLEDHYLSRHDDLVPQLEAALLEHSYGVGFPTRRNPDLIDVIRPRVL